MQKGKLLTGFILGIFIINFASAYYGSYNNFSLTNLLDSIDPSTMFLGIVFFLCLGLINFSLGKTIGKTNRIMSGFMSFLISLGIIYGLNRTNIDFTNLFYNLGISESLFSTAIPIILLIAIVFVFIKLKQKALLVIGTLLIILSFTNLIYAKGLLLIIGIALFLIGLWLLKKKKRFSIDNSFPSESQPRPQNNPSRQNYQQQRALLKQQRKQEAYNRKIRQQSEKTRVGTHNAEVRRRAKNIASIRQQKQDKINKAEQRRQKEQQSIADSHNAEVRRRAKNIASIRQQKQKQINKEIKKQNKTKKQEQRKKRTELRQQQYLEKLAKKQKNESGTGSRRR